MALPLNHLRRCLVRIFCYDVCGAKKNVALFHIGIGLLGSSGYVIYDVGIF